MSWQQYSYTALWLRGFKNGTIERWRDLVIPGIDIKDQIQEYGTCKKCMKTLNSHVLNSF